MTPLSLKDATDLLYKQTGTINGLWNAYATATFAAAGFGVLAKDGPESKVPVAIALTIGYGTFLIGNGLMLRSEIKARSKLGKDLLAVLQKEPETFPFESSLQFLARSPSPVWLGVLVHASIDICAFAAIWAQVYLPAWFAAHIHV